MRRYIPINTDIEARRMRAAAWRAFASREVVSIWQAARIAPANRVPPSWVAAGMPLPPAMQRAYDRASTNGTTFADEIFPAFAEMIATGCDWQRGQWIWQTRQCPRFFVHGLTGGGALIETRTRRGTPHWLDQWKAAGVTVTRPSDATLATAEGLANLPGSAAWARAILSASEDEVTDFATITTLPRAALAGRFAARAAEIEANDGP